MTNRVIYLVPDHAEPAGGMRAIYRHVEHLVAAGRDAVAWHHAPGFTCDWFASTAPVVHGPALDLDDTDLLVVPEVMVDGTDPAPGVRKVVLNQNHFYTFDNAPPGDYPGWTPTPPVWTTSSAGLDVLLRLHPGLPVTRIPYSVDLSLFHPRPRPRRRIVWMPRKRRRESDLLAALLRADDRFAGVELTVVDGVTEQRVAAELGTATVFVALGREEGFGLPVLESLAAGCPVVGYPAGGGAELFAAPGAHAVADEDPLAIVERVAALLADEPADDQRAGYRDWVAATYPAGAERDRLVEAVDTALTGPGAAGTATHPASRTRPDPLTEHVTGLTAELAQERADRARVENVAAALESDLERNLKELDRERRELNLLREELRDLRDERAELRSAAERLVNLEEATALLAEYRQDNDRLNARLDDEIRRVRDLLGSTSWRFTAPFRWVTGTVRGERRG